MSRTLIEPKRLLVTCPHNLGDIIAKVPFIKLLKQRHPTCSIILFARPYVNELANELKLFDEIYDFEQFFLKEPNQIVEELKSLNIDTIIHILSLGKSCGPDIIGYAKAAGIKNRVGNYKRSWSTRLKTKNMGLTHNLVEDRIIGGVHEFQWNLLPLRFFGNNKQYQICDIQSLLKLDLDLNVDIDDIIDSNRFNLVLHPGSNGNAKEWPMSHYKKLIEMLDHNQFNIIITGSKSEAFRFRSLDCEKVKNVMGKLSITQLLAVLQKADGLIGASTGPLHLASLFSTNILGLFANQRNIGPGIWRPLGENASFLQSQKVCTACARQLSVFNSGLCKCMNEISVQSVIDEVLKWVKK